MLFKNDTIKEYTNDAELKSFCEQTWGDYVRSLDGSIISKLLSIQSHGLKQGIGYDDKIIEVYQTELWKFPPVPFDIIVYRGGEMKINGDHSCQPLFIKRRLNTSPIIRKTGFIKSSYEKELI